MHSTLVRRSFAMVTAITLLGGLATTAPSAIADPVGTDADPGVVVDLGTLGGGQSYALDVNDLGYVVGSAQLPSGADHAFRYVSGSMTDLGTLGGSSSYAYAVNASTVTVGQAQRADGTARAFRHSTATGMVELPSLPGGTNAAAVGINAGGTIVGYSNYTGSGTSNHAVRWVPPTYAAQDLGTIGGTPGELAGWDVNDAGVIVGWGGGRGFRWDPAVGVPQDVGGLGGSTTQAIAISNSGVVVGNSRLPGDVASRAFSKAGPLGPMTDLGTLPGQTNSFGNDVNDDGIVVGATSTGSATRAFVRNPLVGSMVDLGTLPGGSTASARAISGTGLIVGYSTNGSDLDRAIMVQNPSVVNKPGSPTGASATPGNASVDVSWTAPVDDGGAPITSYQAYTTPGSISCTTTGTSCQITGLTNGTSYTVKVYAFNVAGGSVGSTPSNQVTPTATTVPGAPNDVTGTPGNGQVALSWTAPADGGSPITGYTVNASPGGQVCTTATTTCTVTGLTNGLPSTFFVSATTSVGDGPVSARSMPYRATACLPGNPVGPFPDVSATNGFCGHIEWLVARNITSGFPDGTYKPSVAVSRKAMAAFMYKLINGDTPAPPCTTDPFADVPLSDGFCDKIQWLVDEGITEGVGDGTHFAPNAPVTRGAMAAFMYRLANGTTPPPPCTTPPFPDVPVSSGFCGHITWLITTGVTVGYPDGDYKPALIVTRGSMAAFLDRLDAHLDTLPA